MRRVLVTGGNRGIGLGFVKQLLSAGDEVFAGCRNPAGANDLQALQPEAGERLVILPLDVTDATSVTHAARVVDESGGHLDLLINNAAVGGDQTALGDIDPAEMLQTYRVNVVGPLMMAQTFRPLLARGTDPFVVHITSLFGSIADNASGGWYAYRVSKAALNMLCANLAIDLKPQGIGSVLLHPGWVRTDMGGSSARLSVEESVSAMLKVIDHLALSDSGKFLNQNGGEEPW